MIWKFAILAAAAVGLSFADTLTLRDGRVIEGSFAGGDAREVRITVGDKVETFEVSAVAKIEFSAPPAPAAAEQPAAAAAVAPVNTVDSKTAEPQAQSAPQGQAAAQASPKTLNGVPALIAIISAAPKKDKAPEVIPNPFLTVPAKKLNEGETKSQAQAQP